MSEYYHSQVSCLTFFQNFQFLLSFIFRFLANEFGLAGKNNAEQAQADEIVDAVNDIFAARVAQTIVKGCIYDTDDKVAALGEQNDDKKSEMMRKLLDETLPNGLVGRNVNDFMPMLIIRHGLRHVLLSVVVSSLLGIISRGLTYIFIHLLRFSRKTILG